MADRPIIFSAPMLKALLSGSKTQTRRALKPQPFAAGYYDGEISVTEVNHRSSLDGPSWRFNAQAVGGGAVLEEGARPRFAPGDRLWIKEAFNVFGFSQDGEVATPVKTLPSKEIFDEVNEEAVRGMWAVHYKASPINDLWDDETRWRSPMFMPRWCSRLTLLVENVKVERLQDISWEDAEAEGVWHGSKEYREQVCIWRDCPSALRRLRIEEYARIWNEINGASAWDQNPWVAAIRFNVIRANIDSAEARDAA